MRDYGLSKPKTISPPRIVAPVEKEACPHCKGVTLFEIEIDVAVALLKHGGIGVGRYLGCAACPYASPMFIAAVEPGVDKS